MKTIRKFSEKLSSFDYIPAKVLEIAIIKSKIDPKSAYEIKKEDLNRSACEFDHGVDVASHIIAAHGYIMAYRNITRADEILNKLPDNPGVALTKTFMKTWLELDKLGIAPVNPEWIVVVNMCVAVALGRPTPLPKLEAHLKSDRLPFHYELRPWRYPTYKGEDADDYIFIQRGNNE